jgi:hypothetical protein
MSIVFYISGHGFGHASRDVEIINRLTSAHNTPIIIRSSVSPDLLRRTLTVPYDLRGGLCDTGVIQASSITQDDPATVRAAVDFYRTFDARVDAEVQALADIEVQLIVGDIPPLAFATAAALGVPSIALGNFTWDWIYETHPGFLPEGESILELIRRCYGSVDLALELPFSGGFDIFPRVEQLPLVARRARHAAAETRRYLGLPVDARIALLSFGGYGLPTLDLSAVDCRGPWTLVTTDRVTGDQGTLPHVRVLAERTFQDSAYRYEDLVAAADVVVTKPGYGTISECISTGTAMVYTSRGSFREYDVLVDAMATHVRSAYISHDDLLAGRWRDVLEGVLTQPAPPARLATDGAEVAARIIDAAAAGRTAAPA